MSEPTPEAVPDPNNTSLAEDENPAEGGSDQTHYTEEQAGLDHDVVTPIQDASLDEQKHDTLPNTDTGAHG